MHWAEFVAGGAACVFLVSSAFKLVRNQSMQQTLYSLGLGRSAHVIGTFIGPFEFLAAAMLCLAPFHRVTSFIVASLAIAFLGAGVVALRRETPVLCACFGSSTTLLGWRQIATTPVWLAVVGLLSSVPDDTERGVGPVLIAVSAAIVWLSMRLRRSYAQARADRLAAPGWSF